MMQRTAVLQEKRFNDQHLQACKGEKNHAKPLLTEIRQRADADDSHVDFQSDIIAYLLNQEKKYVLPVTYLDGGEPNSKMRKVLIDWLVKVQERFRLLPETLQIAIIILDQVLSKKIIGKDRLQLLGLTSIFVAAKVEEVFSPEVYDYEYITDSAFSKKDIFEMERFILSTIGYNLSMPIPLFYTRFLSMYIQSVENVDSASFLHMHSMAKYFIELCYLEHTVVSIPPSRIAMSAILLSLKVTRVDGIDYDSLKRRIMSLFNVKRAEFDLIMQLVASNVLKQLEQNRFTAIKEKYESAKLGHASKLINSEAIQKIRLLAI